RQGGCSPSCGSSTASTRARRPTISRPRTAASSNGAATSRSDKATHPALGVSKGSPQVPSLAHRTGTRKRLLLLRLVVIIHPADHHFLPGLVAPVDIFLGVGIVWVLLRVVVMGDAVNLGPLGHRLGLLEAIDALPVEVVARH